MAFIHEKALEHVANQLRAGLSEIEIQISFPVFQQGQFLVNRVYRFQPPLVGMYSRDYIMMQVNKENLRRIRRFARDRKLKLSVSGMNIFLEDQQRNRVGWLRENFFGATEPELFETMGRDLYGFDVTGEPPRNILNLERKTVITHHVAKRLGGLNRYIE